MQAVSWTALDAASGTLNLQWNLQTTSTSVVVGARRHIMSPEASNQASGTAGSPWTCLFIEQQLWVVNASGVLNKFNINGCTTITSMLITNERPCGSQNMGIEATVLLACPGGVFLQLSLLLKRDECQVTSLSEIQYRSVLHSLPPRPHHPGRSLLPCYTSLLPLAVTAAAGAGAGAGERGGVDYVPVILASHPTFGTEILMQGTRSYSELLCAAAYIITSVFLILSTESEELPEAEVRRLQRLASRLSAVREAEHELPLQSGALYRCNCAPISINLRCC